MSTVNNFQRLKAEFKAETKLDADKEMALYIAYFNGRVNDVSYQEFSKLAKLIIERIDLLPNQIRLEIADMISTHNTIRDLLKK